MVTTSSVVEYLAAEHRDSLVALLESDKGTIRVTDRPIPFGIVVVTRPELYVVVGLYDDRNQLCALVTTDAPAVLDWALAAYADYRDDASPVAVDDLPDA
ncbi:hypothetical protein ACFQH6_04065 [Halobacteriaceae archaeon GCM10025711]